MTAQALNGRIHRVLRFALVAFALQAFNVSAEPPVRHHVWDKTPIPLTLNIDVEKRIEFPAPLATVDLPASLQSPASSLIFTGNTLYWTAHQAWSTTRLHATTTDGTIYFIDTTASADTGDNQPLVILTEQPVDTADAEPPPRYGYVALVRYAAQQLHGPKRLVKPLPGVTQRPVQAIRLPLVQGATLEARPIAQWHAARDGLYVTAVAVQNATDRVIELDPLELRGQWVFAAPHQPSVTPRGTHGDATAWYLVSTAPFDTVTHTLRPVPAEDAGP